MSLEFFYVAIWVIFLFLLLRFQPFFVLEGFSKWTLSFAFLLKCFVTSIFIYIFKNYYGPGVLAFDSIQFFIDGKILNDVFYESPLDYFKLLTSIKDDKELVDMYLHNTGKWYYSYTFFVDDAKSVIRLSSILHFFTFNSFLIQNILFSLMSLIGVYFVSKTVFLYSKLNRHLVFYGILLFPSLLFWSSSLSKEAPLIFGFGILLYSLFYLKGVTFKKGILIVFSLFILMSFKPYNLFVILIVVFLYLVFYLCKSKKVLTIIVLTLISFFINAFFPKIITSFTKAISFKQHDFICTGIGGTFFHDSISRKEYNIQSDQYKNIIFINYKVKILKPTIINEINRFERNVKSITIDSTNNQTFFKGEVLVKSNSYVPVTPIKMSFKQLILNIPEALINCLFRPWFGDPGKDLKHFATFETIFLFTFLLFAVIFRRKLEKNEKRLVFSLLLFALLISILIGWIVPILGAIVRYRITSYLALLIVGIIIINPSQKWKQKENMS
jgi:hypothetical protein